MSAFVDTNVILYAAGLSEAEAKRDRARQILAETSCVFSIQVLNEFVFQSTRPRRDPRLSMEEAIGTAVSLTRFPVLGLDLAMFRRAADVQRRTTYDWWDSLIVAAAITAGCDTLLTEDLQHGRVIDGVRIENPFRELA